MRAETAALKALCDQLGALSRKLAKLEGQIAEFNRVAEAELSRTRSVDKRCLETLVVAGESEAARHRRVPDEVVGRQSELFGLRPRGARGRRATLPLEHASLPAAPATSSSRPQ